MKLERRQEGTVEVLEPNGALVDEDVLEFSEVLEAQLCGLKPRFVISMKEVPYLDSLAIEALLDTSDALREQSFRLKLAALTPTCREIMELAALEVLDRARHHAREVGQGDADGLAAGVETHQPPLRRQPRGERVEGHEGHIAVHPAWCYLRRLPRAQGFEMVGIKGAPEACFSVLQQWAP